MGRAVLARFLQPFGVNTKGQSGVRSPNFKIRLIILPLNSFRRKLMTWKPRYFDIAVNFSDPQFQGRYHGSNTIKHPSDIDDVISRAQLFGVDKILITSSNIMESEDHFDLVSQHLGSLASTVGVHPCSVASEFYGGLDKSEPLEDVEAKLSKLKSLAIDGHNKGYVRAFGEIGLDYDRLHYLTAEQQKEMFRRQLEVHSTLSDLKLPLFLHMRAACNDFTEIIKPFVDNGSILPGNGVVHSFTGTKEELEKILSLGFHVGVNGCSLRSQENLDVAKLIPIDKLLIETDAPWCELRKTHASYPLIAPYPSIFYPKIENDAVGVVTENSDSTNNKASQRRKDDIKLDDILPFPSIKKENWTKHKAIVQKKLENLDSANTETGDFASPLIKSRNEPIFTACVASVMANLYNITEEEDIRQFIETVYKSSCSLFQL